MLTIYTKKHKTASPRPVVVFLLATCVFGARDAHALRRIDELSGVDQSFTRGYDYRRYSETSHEGASYELLVPDEEKETAEKKKAEDEQKHVDQWRYSRAFTASTIYNSNVRGTYIDPEGEFFQNFNPSFGMSRRGEHSYVNLFYDLSYTNYTETEKLNSIRHTQRTDFGYFFGRLRLDFSNTISPGIAYDTAERTELENTELAAGAAGRRRVSALKDTFTSSLSLRATPKTTLGVIYVRDLTDIPVSTNSRTANNFSNVTHTITPNLRYQWTPKTAFFANYSYGKEDYFEPSGDKTAFLHALNGGVSSRIFGRNFVTLKLGYQHREYEFDVYEPENNLSWALTLSRKLTEKLSVSLSSTKGQSRNFDAVTDDGGLTEDELYYGVDFTFKMSPRLTLDFGGSLGYISADGLVTQTDPDNPTLTFTRAPETQLYEWYATLGWSPRPFVTTLIGYQFTKQNASFKDNERDDHKMLGSLSTRF